jgi:hypothetical protein
MCGLDGSQSRIIETKINYETPLLRGFLMDRNPEVNHG